MSTIYKNGTPYLGITQAQDMSVQVGDNTLNLQSAIQNILGDFAPIESNPVSKAYTVGQYLIFNGNLYKVTTDIAQGGTLVIGTNVQATTVNNELTNLGAAAYQGVANNLSTTTEGSVLDARQGKVLNDNILVLNNQLDSNYIISTIDSEQIALDAGKTNWFNTNIPSSYKKPTMVGYYINGSGNGFMNVYAAYCSESIATVAVRNMGTSTLSISIKYYLRHF